MRISQYLRQKIAVGWSATWRYEWRTPRRSEGETHHIARKLTSILRKTSEPPPKTLDPKIRIGTPKNGTYPSRFSWKAKVLDDAPCKIKKIPPMGRFQLCWTHQDTYGRRSRLSNQPREGPHWKAQEKIFRPSERRADQRLKLHECMALDEPCICFKNNNNLDRTYLQKSKIHIHILTVKTP